MHTLDLDLNFHLHRKTGELTRIMDRGTNSIQSILSTVIFNIGPQIFDIAAACVYLATALQPWIAVIVFVTLVSYIPVTIYFTEWRGNFRRQASYLRWGLTPILLYCQVQGKCQSDETMPSALPSCRQTLAFLPAVCNHAFGLQAFMFSTSYPYSPSLCMTIRRCTNTLACIAVPCKHPQDPFSFCRDLNRLDNAKSAKATDALLNYETVKYFSNEELERRNFEKAIRDYQKVEYTLIASLNGLNVLQSVIIWSGMIGGLIVCTQVITHFLHPFQAALSLPAWCCSRSTVHFALFLLVTQTANKRAGNVTCGSCKQQMGMQEALTCCKQCNFLSVTAVCNNLHSS